ncbi:MAG: phosphoribosylglycinamide synthetase, partial [Desulfovibrionaceae bacterium]|nr:phosphoribosylglycinamide synthetase [Desulfovibrionaceae bacterium]
TPIAAGIDLARQAILQAVGEPVRREDLLPKPGQPVAIRFFFPEPGLIESVSGYEELSRHPWIVLKRLSLGPGDAVQAVTDHTRRGGCVMTVGATIDEADARARQAVSEVIFNTRRPGGHDGPV